MLLSILIVPIDKTLLEPSKARVASSGDDLRNKEG